VIEGLTAHDVERLAYSSLAGEYDFIVCGAASSDSVVARRLAENPDVSARVPEAGGHDATPSVMTRACGRPILVANATGDSRANPTRISTTDGSAWYCRNSGMSGETSRRLIRRRQVGQCFDSAK
jgi:choline dehydrogenase-like flavoprotein